MATVDLHSHTTASDGVLSPRELVQAAVRRGLRVLAITDHDSTDGLAEARDEASHHPGFTVVAGLEINCDVEGGEVHVLGYCVDDEAGWFQDFLRAQRVERANRVHRITDRLAELGMPIDPAEVFALCKEGSPGRPHVARAMVHRGYVRSVNEAFDRYLHTDGPAHVPRKRLTPVEAVGIIRRARGVPVLAHPGRDPGSANEPMLSELLDAGLGGIECFHPSHDRTHEQRFLDVCARHALIATGGSDFHTPDTHQLGRPGAPDGAYDELVGRAR
jgi:hypothetical protein